MGTFVARIASLAGAVLIILSTGSPGRAQEIDPAALEQSRTILNLTNTQALGEQMITMIMPQVTDLVVRANPSKEEVVRELVSRYLEPSLRESLPELLEDCAAIYARHFTVSELTELAAFYGTPLGQKLIRTQSAILVDLNQVGQVWGMRAAGRAMQKLVPILKERGLEVPA